MPEPVKGLPDVLVLGAGGTLGIAWLRGVVVGLEEASGLDLRECEYFVGTSAGAYVAAALAAGHGAGEDVADPGRRPDVASEAPEPATGRRTGPVRRLAGETGKLAAAMTAPFMPLALSMTRPGGAAARAAVLRVTPRPDRPASDVGRRVAGLGGSFDGRLRVVAVDRARGARVVFGAPGAPRAEVAEAVQASCAVPWLFAPVVIAGREYVDGGVWSLSNLDAAPAGRGSRVLALLPTFGRVKGRGPLGVLRAAGQAAGLAELQVLRARGVHARIVAPDIAATDAIGPNLMNPRRRAQVFAAGRAQGLRLGGGSG